MSGLLDNVQLRLVDSIEELEGFIKWFRERCNSNQMLGIDTETSGFSPEHDVIRLVQVGDRETGWALAWDDWRGIASWVINTYPGWWVLHNSKFDVRHVARSLGFSVQEWPWHRTHDAMCLAHILDSQRPKGLKPLSAKYVDGRAMHMQGALDDGMKKNGWDWGTVPIEYPPYWQYGALDPVLTVHMAERMLPEVLANYAELYDIEMAAIRVAAKMEERGTRVDMEYSRTKGNALRRYANEAHQYLDETYGLATATPLQLLKFFQDNNVFIPEKLTGTGRQSMDKEVMDGIDHEVAKIIQAIKRAEKWSTTYFDNFIKFADSNGYIHPSINTMAARTGRMSITEPALQTLPSIGDTIRNAFIPSPGNSLLTIDADQIEARLTAHFSGDAGLIAAFGDTVDFFCSIGTSTYGYEVTKGMQERDLMKKVVYGKVYGSSVAKMALGAGVPIHQMEVANAAFENRFPGVRELQMRIINAGKQIARADPEERGSVVTPYGRVLRSDKGKEYTLVNYLIQCHASEILKKKIVALDAALPEEAAMVLPVHDEIIFDVPTDIVYDVKREAEAILNQSEGYLVPVTWSGDVLHESWGEKYR